jgi:hypothetical protein
VAVVATAAAVETAELAESVPEQAAEIMVAMVTTVAATTTDIMVPTIFPATTIRLQRFFPQTPRGIFDNGATA